MTSIRIVIFLILLLPTASISAQKYPSLLWEVTGNGLTKPSYLYGTMHVSSKIAFYLGDPFFDALEKSDMVALELEPEVWFDEVLSDRNQFREYSGDYGGSYGEWNGFRGYFELDLNVNNTIKMLYMQDPMAYNTLLFRMYEASGNFEEDTWLDMYIYQSARKLGKKTVGLETYQMANDMMDKATREMEEEDRDAAKKRKQLSYTERQEVALKIEDSYRKANLDQLDSLNALLSHPAFIKYILVERNKNFVLGLDTMMRKQSVFAGFGAAHLPGDEGCIELLREMGYTVKPVDMGKRNAKKRQKLEDLILKRQVSRYTSPDGYLSFEIPGTAYSLGGGFHGGNILAMDIPNGTNFMINRIPSHSAFLKRTPAEQLKSLDSILYEVIPGEIISRKDVTVSGYPAIDITNKTRRGDIHRSQIIFLPDEIIIARLSATGDKLKRGLGSYFFSSFEIRNTRVKDWQQIASVDGSFAYEAPGRPVSFTKSQSNRHFRTVREYVQADNRDVFVVYRIITGEPGYLEEDPYNLMKLEDALANDLDIELIKGRREQEGAQYAQFSVYEPYKGKAVYARFTTHALASYAFVAFTNDSNAASRFLNSCRLGNSGFDTLYEIIDSTVFFTAKVPWEVENKNRSSSGYSSMYSTKKPNPASEYTKYKAVYPPEATDRIHVTYKRFKRYDYVHDTATFMKVIEKYMTHGYDEHIENKSVVWDSNGMVADYHTSDTFTSRMYHFRVFFRNRSMHTVKTTYDRTLGEGPVSLAFLENFKPMEDTLSVGSYLESPLDELMKDIVSADTITFEGANEFRFNAYRQYKEEEALELFTLLMDTVSPLAEKEHKEYYARCFVELQFLDDSPEHMKEMASTYRQSSDSSLRQMEILVNLLKMNNREGYLMAKKLILEEAPIGKMVSASHPFFISLLDSMELARLLFPEILDLTAYDEYETGVVLALARMLDSNAINHQAYASYLPYFVREAKVQARRFSSATQEEKDEKYAWEDREWTYRTDPLMLAYWNLLYPYKNKPEVAAIYSLASASAKMHVREAYAKFRASKDEKISDSECAYLTGGLTPLYRYSMLRDLKRMDLLSDTSWVQVYIDDQIRTLRSNFNGYSYTPIYIDSFTFTGSHEDSIRRHKYTTYYVKFKKTVNNKTTQKYAVLMVEMSDDGFPPYEYYSSSSEIEVDQTEEELFEEIRNNLISGKRDNGYNTEVDRDLRYNFLYSMQ